MASLLAVDGGGTSTRCQVVDEEFGVLAEVTGPPCALAVDLERALEALAETVQSALQQAADQWRRLGAGRDRGPLRLASACLGLSGLLATGADQQVRAALCAALRKAGLSLSAKRVVVVSDIEIAHAGALGGEAGIVLVVGTGAVAFGRNAAGQSARADGWGWLLGDGGSGFWIGQRALQAVCAAADGRGEPTGLTEPVLAHFGVGRVDELPRALYGTFDRTRIAAVALLVAQQAEAGDAVSREILRCAGEELGTSVLGVLRRLPFPGDSVVVSWQGSVIRRAPGLAAQVEAAVRAVEPRCRFRAPQAEPIAGAVLLARRAAGA